MIITYFVDIFMLQATVCFNDLIGPIEYVTIVCFILRIISLSLGHDNLKISPFFDIIRY